MTDRLQIISRQNILTVMFVQSDAIFGLRQTAATEKKQRRHKTFFDSIHPIFPQENKKYTPNK